MNMGAESLSYAREHAAQQEAAEAKAERLYLRLQELATLREAPRSWQQAVKEEKELLHVNMEFVQVQLDALEAKLKMGALSPSEQEQLFELRQGMARLQHRQEHFQLPAIAIEMDRQWRVMNPRKKGGPLPALFDQETMRAAMAQEGMKRVTDERIETLTRSAAASQAITRVAHAATRKEEDPHATVNALGTQGGKDWDTPTEMLHEEGGEDWNIPTEVLRENQEETAAALHAIPTRQLKVGSLENEAVVASAQTELLPTDQIPQLTPPPSVASARSGSWRGRQVTDEDHARFAEKIAAFQARKAEIQAEQRAFEARATTEYVPRDVDDIEPVPLAPTAPPISQVETMDAMYYEDTPDNVVGSDAAIAERATESSAPPDNIYHMDEYRETSPFERPAQEDKDVG